MTATSLNEKFGYLKPAAEAWFPTDPAAFRAIYQRSNNRAPEYRLEGLTSMTDDQITELARTLQTATIQNPSKINDLWAAVCEQGRQIVEEQP
jgi:hypothetical protein